jgi:hypothetical protein
MAPPVSIVQAVDGGIRMARLKASPGAATRNCPPEFDFFREISGLDHEKIVAGIDMQS